MAPAAKSGSPSSERAGNYPIAGLFLFVANAPNFSHGFSYARATWKSGSEIFHAKQGSGPYAATSFVLFDNSINKRLGLWSFPCNCGGPARQRGLNFMTTVSFIAQVSRAKVSRRLPLPGLLAVLMLTGLAGTANAQRNSFPPGQIQGGQYSGGNDTAGQALRIDKLENRVRKLTGEIEQLQFQMGRMQKQLEAFQKDIDFRFKEQSGGKTRRPDRRSDLGDPPPAAADPRINTARPDTDDPPAAGSPPVVATGPSGGRRGDVFNPAANPSAPGAPRQLGSPGNVASAPLPGGPLGQSNPGTDVPNPDGPVNLVPGSAPTQPPLTAAPTVPPPDASPRQSYRIAMAAMRVKRYDDAELGFKSFLQRFPKSTLADDVYFNLGETYYRRGRYREAAEQFLKVSTDYRKSSRAPDSLYMLGLALEKLGAREQACASYAEVERRYPRAPGGLRARVDRQIARAKC